MWKFGRIGLSSFTFLPGSDYREEEDSFPLRTSFIWSPPASQLQESSRTREREQMQISDPMYEILPYDHNDISNQWRKDRNAVECGTPELRSYLVNVSGIGPS